MHVAPTCAIGWFTVDMGGHGLFKTVAKTHATMEVSTIAFQEVDPRSGGWGRPGEWTQPAPPLEVGQKLIGVRICSKAGFSDPANALRRITESTSSYAEPYVAAHHGAGLLPHGDGVPLRSPSPGAAVS